FRGLVWCQVFLFEILRRGIVERLLGHWRLLFWGFLVVGLFLLTFTSFFGGLIHQGHAYGPVVVGSKFPSSVALSRFHLGCQGPKTAGMKRGRPEHEPTPERDRMAGFIISGLPQQHSRARLHAEIGP